MRRIALRLLPLLGAAAAVLGLTLASAGAASASVNPNARYVPGTRVVFAGNVGTQFSEDLAGYSLDGNGADIVDGAWRGITVPQESSAVPADAIVHGIIMAQSVAVGGFAAAEGLVWDDPAGCGPGTWTLEAGTGLITLPGQPVLPTSDLHPLLHLGVDVCVAPGGTEFVYLYNSHRHHEVQFSAGASSHDWNVLKEQFTFTKFRTAGSGVFVQGGVAAANLTLGNNFGPAGLGFFLDGQGNSVFGQGFNMAVMNYDSWQATLTGGAPSVANPYTMNTNPLTTLTGTKNSGGQFEVDVP